MSVILTASILLTFLFFPPKFAPIFTTYNVPKYAILKLTLPLLLVLWLVSSLRKGRMRITRTPLDIPLLIFSAISALSLVVAVNVYEGLGVLYQQSIFIALFFVVSSNIIGEVQTRRLLGALVGVGALVTVYGLIQVAGVEPFSFSRGRGPISTLGNRNYVADLLVMTIPLALGLFLFCRSIIWRIIYALVVLSMALLLGWTYSKGGLISLIVALFGVTFFAGLYRRERMVSLTSKLMIVALGILSLFLAIVVPFYYNRDEGGDLRDDPVAESATKRFYLYQGGLRMIVDHPLIGVGIGNWGVLHPKYPVFPNLPTVSVTNRPTTSISRWALKPV